MPFRLPIFPLGVVLFPGTPLPLHIFEPRYRQMLADCLAGDRRFGITPAGTDDELPEPGTVGCIAEVRVNQELPDGRSNIVVLGGERFVLDGAGGRARPVSRGAGAAVRGRSRHRPAGGRVDRTLRELFSGYHAPPAPAQRHRAGGPRPARRRASPSPSTWPPRSTATRASSSGSWPSARPRGGSRRSSCCCRSSPRGSSRRSRCTAGRTPTAGAALAPTSSPDRDPGADRRAGPDRRRALGAPPPGRARDLHHGRPSHPRVVSPAWSCMPADAAQVREVVRLLHLVGVPFVARGAGTGLSGGAVADPDAVLIALTRMNRILAVDPVRRRATVQPGRGQRPALRGRRCRTGCTTCPIPPARPPAPWAATWRRTPAARTASSTASPPITWSSSRWCSPTASVVRLGSPPGRAVGTRPRRALRGQRGDVRHRHRDRGAAGADSRRACAPCWPTSPPCAPRARRSPRSSPPGIVPAALEMMDQACVAAVEASIYAAGYPTDAAAVLLVELDGSADAVEAESRHRERDPARARRARGAERLHAGRSRTALAGTEEGVRRDGADRARSGGPGRGGPPLRPARHHGPDRGDPRAVTGSPSATSSMPGTAICIPNISFDRRDRGPRRHGCTLACREIMAACVAAGGSITGEHGVGSDKIDYMPLIFDPDTLARHARGAPGVRSRRAGQSRQGGAGPRLPRVAGRRRRVPMSDVVFGRLRALLGTGGVERDPAGLPRATPGLGRRALAGLPAGARGGLEDPGRGPRHLAPARRAGRSRGEHPRAGPGASR